MADPPGVHPGAPHDVWSTERSAYALLAELVTPGMHTIETGCGSSTAIFAMCGAEHLCATFIQSEADAFRAWADAHEVDSARVTFLIGPSERTLPPFEGGPFDVAFIDGNHAFPAPVLDWFYLVPMLLVGGVVFVDDVQLPAPRLVADYMESCAPVWQRLARTEKWSAYRLTDSPPPESWARPAAGASLFGGNGRFERVGRRLDGAVRRIRRSS